MSDVMQNILIVSVIILASILAYQGFKFRELEEITLDVFRTICRDPPDDWKNTVL